MHQGDALTLTKLGNRVPKAQVDHVTAQTWSQRTKAFRCWAHGLAGGEFKSQHGGREWREKL